MKRVVGIVLLMASLSILTETMVTSASDAGGQGPRRIWWTAPDSAWAVVGFGWLSKERVASLLDRKPEKIQGLLMLEKIVEEEGEWLWIRVKLHKVKNVTFTKNAKLVIRDSRGRKIESEAFVFWPDYEQTSLYDSRESPVVVSMHSVWRGVENTSPCGCVKFPPGSVRAGDIISFEVVGAVPEEDREREK